MNHITRRSFCARAMAAVAGTVALPASLPSVHACGGNPGRSLPLPTPEQLAWQDRELGLFIHFDMSTFTGQSKPRTPADPNVYNPAKLDTDQWLEVAKGMGAQYAVFVAKHCTGFLSWQSDAYPYGVRQTSWRGGKADVVRDFVESCRKYHVKPGLYASASSNAWWTVDDPGLVNWGKGGDAAKQAEYVRACERMLTELWSRYGELSEIWFDGGALPPEKGGPDLVPILKKHQPHAVVFQGPARSIRWIGNEEGVANYPCWATVSGDGDVNGPGDPNGDKWLAGECDVPLPGHEWFWSPKQKADIQPLQALMDKYYKSVGHNCNLLLNATPDKTGLIPEANLKHYLAFGAEIRRRFGTALAETKGNGDLIELKLRRPTTLNHVILMEEIAHGERIRRYELEGLTAGNIWKPLASGTAVGHKRIQQFASTEVTEVRLRITESVAAPRIRRLAVFNVS